MAETHALNCALLVGDGRDCSCGQLPSANSPEGRKHHVGCRRITSAGKYDASQECDCPKPLQVHNHGPNEGRGLNCPEYVLPGGERRGHCTLSEWDRRQIALEVVPAPAVPALRAGTVPSLASEFPDASQGEVRTTSATGGQKGVKEARFDLIPTEALTKLAEHYAVGARKYGDHNWRKGFEYSKSYAALQRHLVAWWGGEDLDPETGKSHLTAVAFHAFTLLTFQAEHPEFDDRFKKGATDGEITE